MSARFKVRNVTQDGPWSPHDDGGFFAEAGDVIALQLEELPAPDANECAYSIDALSLDCPAPEFPDGPTTRYLADPPTAEVLLELPGSGVHSLRVQCQVNGGEAVPGADGRPDRTVNTKSRGIAILSSLGLRKQLVGERSEFGPLGWTAPQNDMVDAIEQVKGIAEAAVGAGVQSVGAAAGSGITVGGTTEDPIVGLTAGTAATADLVVRRDASGTIVNRRDGVGDTEARGVTVSNQTAAADGAPQRSPLLLLEARTWDYELSASRDVKYALQVREDAQTGKSSLFLLVALGADPFAAPIRVDHEGQLYGTVASFDDRVSAPLGFFEQVNHGGEGTLLIGNSAGTSTTRIGRAGNAVQIVDGLHLFESSAGSAGDVGRLADGRLSVFFAGGERACLTEGGDMPRASESGGATLEAEVNTVLEWEVPEGFSLVVEATIIGDADDGSKDEITKMQSVRRPAGGAAALHGPAAALHSAKDNAGTDLTFAVELGYLQVKATGVAGRQHYWTSSVVVRARREIAVPPPP